MTNNKFSENIFLKDPSGRSVDYDFADRRGRNLAEPLTLH
jgi:hypothetical protein